MEIQLSLLVDFVFWQFSLEQNADTGPDVVVTLYR